MGRGGRRREEREGEGEGREREGKERAMSPPPLFEGSLRLWARVHIEKTLKLQFYKCHYVSLSRTRLK